MKLPKWCPSEPRHTCPSIDRVKDKLRDAHDIIASAMGDLEELSSENGGLRDWAHDIASMAQDIIDDRDAEIEDLKSQATERT